ncbi:DUF3526 domain-containing protein [Longitalea arenae]|uniref:DUF3526 domain-containing protein n=1 Tax=Longitalea arenae TaxID=2812558 RepID=UPI001967645C|nr:DUF3526 domain-containing protein [Longitalea arenae]
MRNEIIQFEWRHWLLRPVTLLLILAWVLVLTAIYGVSNASAKDNRLRQTDLLSAQQMKRTAHLAQVDSFVAGLKKPGGIWDDPTNAYLIGLDYGRQYFVKQPLPLTAFSYGHSHIHPAIATINTAADNWFIALKKSETLVNPHNSIFGNIDPAGAVLFLLPLLVIVLNFNIISAEREAGRLPILAVQGVSIRQWIWYKAGFRFLALTLITILTLLLNHWSGSSATMGAGGMAMTGFVVAVALYSACWHALSAWINLYKKSSDFNAGLLFAIWISQLMVIPGLTTVIGTALRPTEGKVKLIDEVRETLTEFDRKNSQLLDQFYTDHPHFAAKDSVNVMPLFVYKYVVKYMHTLEKLTPVMNHYKKDALEQAHTAEFTSVISPAMIFQELSDEFAGNSQTQFLLFQQQADSMVRNWNDYINPKALANQQLGREELSVLADKIYEPKVAVAKIGWLTGALFGWLGLLLLLVSREVRNFTVI